MLTAYGEGAKPEICAYKIAKPDPAVWTYTGTNNLWRIDLGDYSKFDGNHVTRSGNVGFLKVDGRIFGRIVDFATANAYRCHFKQDKGKKSLLIDDVNTIEEAVELLKRVKNEL